jgi:hypothetical protein
MNIGEECQSGVLTRDGPVDWLEMFPGENKQEPLLLENKFSNYFNSYNLVFCSNASLQSNGQIVIFKLLQNK